MTWTVELEPGCWLADCDGDPGRTLQEDNAKAFESKTAAQIAMYFARDYRPFAKAKVVKKEGTNG